MQINIQITKAELAEMEATQEQIQQGIVQRLDGGKVYLAGFNVDVQIVD